MSYDARVALHGEVPTRADNWHDLLNALTFMAFPHAKRALHARQYRCLARELGPDGRLPAHRSSERDTLTLFDEGGVIVAHDRRGNSLELVFGHALLEHLATGRAWPIGFAVEVAVETLDARQPSQRTQVDQALSAALADPARFRAPSEGKRITYEQLSFERRHARVRKSH